MCNFKLKNWIYSCSFEQEEKESKKKIKNKFGQTEGDEDEEMPDMENNPFALMEGRTNENLYGTDPKKFLKEW
jgi:hypothetical protein